MAQESTPAGAAPDPALRARLAELREEGEAIWDRFDVEVRQKEWHPFVAADYGAVQAALLALHHPGARFLEWGSAAGVITIMADLMGYEAYGIEIDGDLVEAARGLAARFDSDARFALGSFLPAGYEFRSPGGDGRTGTIGRARSGYLELGRPLEDFDVVFGYPWIGEEPVMHDLMRTHGGRGAVLLLHGARGVEVYRAGRRVG
jgi:hypothetical protein